MLLWPALMLLMTPSADGAVIARKPLEPRQIADLLEQAKLDGWSAASGVCADFPRKAELSRLNAERAYLASYLDGKFGPEARSHMIYVANYDGTNCDHYADFRKYTDSYWSLLLRARTALGLEN